MKFKFPETTLKYLNHHTNNIILHAELCIKSVFFAFFYATVIRQQFTLLYQVCTV